MSSGSTCSVGMLFKKVNGPPMLGPVHKNRLGQAPRTRGDRLPLLHRSVAPHVRRLQCPRPARSLLRFPKRRMGGGGFPFNKDVLVIRNPFVLRIRFIGEN